MELCGPSPCRLRSCWNAVALHLRSRVLTGGNLEAHTLLPTPETLLRIPSLPPWPRLHRGRGESQTVADAGLWPSAPGAAWGRLCGVPPCGHGSPRPGKLGGSRGARTRQEGSGARPRRPLLGRVDTHFCLGPLHQDKDFYHDGPPENPPPQSPSLRQSNCSLVFEPRARVSKSQE